MSEAVREKATNLSYREFVAGVQRGLGEGFDDVTNDELERAYSALRISTSMAASALSLLRSTDRSQRWNKSLLLAAIKLASHYVAEIIAKDETKDARPQDKGEPDVAAETTPQQEQPVVSAVTADETAHQGISSQYVEILTPVLTLPDVDKNSESVEGQGKTENASTEPEATMDAELQPKARVEVSENGPEPVSEPVLGSSEETMSTSASLPTEKMRLSKRARVREAFPSRNETAIPTFDDINVLGGKKNFADLTLDQQRVVVTSDLSSAFGVSANIVKKLLDPHALGSFSPDELKLAYAIRDHLGLQISKGMAGSNGILADVQSCFGGQDVNRRLASFLGLRTEVKGDRRQIKATSDLRRVHAVRGLIDRPDLGERDLLRGLRFIGLYRSNIRELEDIANSDDELAS